MNVYKQIHNDIFDGLNIKFYSLPQYVFGYYKILNKNGTDKTEVDKVGIYIIKFGFLSKFGIREEYLTLKAGF